MMLSTDTAHVSAMAETVCSFILTSLRGLRGLRLIMKSDRKQKNVDDDTVSRNEFHPAHYPPLPRAPVQPVLSTFDNASPGQTLCLDYLSIRPLVGRVVQAVVQSAWPFGAVHRNWRECRVNG